MKIGVGSVYCDWERYEDRSGVSILSLGEVSNLICNFSLSV